MVRYRTTDFKRTTELSMYINGRELSLEELEQFTHKLLAHLIDDLYNTVINDGAASIFPGDEAQQHKLIKKMIEHYIDTEQYERCAVLSEL
mgnify:CR=1 FL=1